MIPILSGNVASATAAVYEVANSCRFNDDDSPSMYKTPGSGGNQTTWTFSTWFKRGNISTSQWIFDAFDGAGDEFHILISSGNAISIYTIGGGFGDNLTITSSNLVRDCSAWYHLVVRCDTTQGTASDRLRVYLNGAEVTYSTYNNFSHNGEGQVSESGTKHWIGRRNAGDHLDGYLAETVLVDGSSLAPTSFGEFNSDSPTIWQPIDVSGLTFGTNGFYLDYEDSSNLGNDANGGTDFTEANLAATDQAEDSPTNNFATMNPLYHPPSNPPTLSEGNCKVVSSSALLIGGIGSTIGVANGKWYVEVKVIVVGAGTQIGVTSDPSADAAYVEGRQIGFLSTSFGYQQDGKEVTNDTRGTYGASYHEDIVGMALDCDNNKIYYSKNGGWSDGDGTSDASTPNDYQTITAPASTPTGFYFFGASDGSSSATNTYEFNFGNPTFSISSGNADANSYGNFEYAVPSGYLALCTKNLGSDGG